MMIGITGTPGTGKSTVAHELRARGHMVTALSSTTTPYIVERDEERDTLVIDEESWAREFPRVEGFVEGHLAHLLSCDLIVVLRCRPDVLAERLRARGYSEAKVRENVEAEALDVTLIETLEEFRGDQVLEIDTTDRESGECARLIEEFSQGKIPPSFGNIDWSGYLGEAL
ncbi:MAG: putative kinase [Methanoregulaceae archaeon PtaB.Bin056]|jgi:adenylate kinase|nr:MAG: putative kinase [Methanoregulaceae archaeon PtaB.Bin056]